MALRRKSVSKKLIEGTGALEDLSGDDSGMDALETQEALVHKLIRSCQVSQEKGEKLPVSVGDMIRLFQFQREMEKARPADIIEVRWIDPDQDSQP